MGVARRGAHGQTAERAAITTLCEGRIAEALEQFDVALENSDGIAPVAARDRAVLRRAQEDAANDFERNAETFEEMIGEPATEYLICAPPRCASRARRRAARDPARHQPDAAGTRRALPSLQNAFDLSIDGEARPRRSSAMIASPKRVSRSEQFDTDELQRVQDLDDSAIDAHLFAGLWAESRSATPARARARIAAADASRRIAEAPRRFPNPAIGGLAFRCPRSPCGRARRPDGGVRPDSPPAARPLFLMDPPTWRARRRAQHASGRARRAPAHPGRGRRPEPLSRRCRHPALQPVPQSLRGTRARARAVRAPG